MRAALIRTFQLLAAAALAGLLSACGGSDDAAPPPSPPAAAAPTITTAPGAVAVTEGEPATFSVVATGDAPLNYQWLRGGAYIGGATAASYTLASATLADSGAAFSVRVGNRAGSVTSSAGVLTVSAMTVAPVITTQPGAVSIAAGGSASFTVATSGTPAPTVQWLIAGGADLADGAGSAALTGATIAGASTATLTLTNVPQAANGLLLAARASNSAGAATSNNAALTVSAAGVAISAAAGGTATSPDGKVRAVFPPDAFTADTVVSFTPVPAPALPSGNEPFAEDFASFQPVAGGFYRIDFAGGLLKPDVEVEYGVQSQAAPAVMARAMAQRERPLSPPPGGAPQVTVIRCSNGQTQVYMGAPGAGYDTARAILCGGNPSNSVTVGPAVLIPPPAATLGERTLARTGNDKLLNAISFNNGRSAFGFEGLVPPGNLVVGLGVVAANGSIATGVPPGGATLAGFDGTGQVLAGLSGCRLAAFNVRVSSLLGAFIASTPQWIAQLPLVGRPPFQECAGVFAAAPVAGGQWIVARGNELDRYSSTGVATPLLRPLPFPQSDIRRQISYRRLAVDAVGNIWGVGPLNSSNFSDCGFSSFGPCPALVKLDAAGNLLSQAILGAALAQRPAELAPMALTLDAAGNAYAAQPSTELVFNGSTTGTGGIVVSRFAANGTRSWSALLSNSRDQALGEVAVNGTTGQVFVSTAPNGIVYRLDSSGAETGKVSAGAPFARSVISGLSINPAGTLTLIGDLSGTLGTATSATCIPPDTRPCVDVFLRRFNF